MTRSRWKPKMAGILFWKCAATTLVAALLGAIATLYAPVSSASTVGSYFEWNVQGLIGRGPDGGANDALRGNEVIYIATRMMNEQFVAVGLNEICPVQYGVIALNVYPDYTMRYAERFHRDYHSGAGFYCKDGYGRAAYGNAIAEKFTFSYSEAYYNGLPTVNYNSSGHETSWIWPNTLCMRTNFIFLGHQACTAHFYLRPSEKSDLWAYTIFTDAKFRVMMGDFNKPRSGMPISYFSDFREADLCPTTGCSGKRDTSDNQHSPRDIDYIFSHRQSTGAGQNAIITPMGYSDHHVVRGYFTLY